MKEERYDRQEIDMSKLHIILQISMALIFKKPLYYIVLITWRGKSIIRWEMYCSSIPKQVFEIF